MKKRLASPPGDFPAEKKIALIQTLKNSELTLNEKKVTAGFDGFIDSIVRIIHKKQAGETPTFFTSISQFGEYITQKQAASFSLELEEQSMKPGGNMPIMANALGSLGIHVNCIGALGHPQPHPVFIGLSPRCHPFSFAEPGLSTAFEFNDGKIFFAQMGALNTTGWTEIKEKIGINTLNRLYTESDLVCLLNWSELDASTDIWKGLLQDIFRNKPLNKKQMVFADLSDCSKRSDGSIKEALGLLKEFGRYSRVILSLNRNEASILYKVIMNDNTGNDLFETGQKLAETLALDIIVIHSAREVVAFGKNEQVAQLTFYTDQPKISTGAGDNFNAGFCTAQLLELDLQSAVLFANAVSGTYIRTGTSSRPTDVIEFLETHDYASKNL